MIPISIPMKIGDGNLSLGSEIQLEILDVIVKFELLSATEHKDQECFAIDRIYLSPRISYSIHFPEESADPCTTAQLITLFQDLQAQLDIRCRLALEDCGPSPRAAVRSLAITGPAGAGKSAFLRSWIERRLQSEARKTIVLQVNGKDISHTALPKGVDDWQVAEASDDDCREVLRLLKVMMALLGSIGCLHRLEELLRSSDEEIRQSRICIIIDGGIECIAHRDGLSGDSRPLGALRLCHSFSRLLHILSTTSFAGRIFLLATSRLDAGELHAAASASASTTVRFPEFDAIVALPRPSPSERSLLLQRYMEEAHPSRDLIEGGGGSFDGRESKISKLVGKPFSFSVLRSFIAASRKASRAASLPETCFLW